MEKTGPFRKALIFPLENWRIVYRVHATRRMFERDINEADLLACIGDGNVTENYPGDFPFPSFLVNGTTIGKYPLHAVVGVNRGEKILYIITVYVPDQARWTNDFSERKLP